MSAISHLEVSGYINNTTFGNVIIAPSFLDNSPAPDYQLFSTLASGDNTYGVPTFALGVMILFDSTSTTTKKLKGVPADTGVTLGTSGFNLIIFDKTAPPSSITINSSAADTGKYTHILFF